MKSCFDFFPSFLILFLLSSTSTVLFVSQVACADTSIWNNNDLETQTYIIRMQPPTNLSFTSEDLKSWYNSLLQPLLNPTGTLKSRVIHSYSTVFSGFVATLTTEEVKQLEKIDGFLKAFPDRLLPLMTTHSPAFLGLNIRSGLWEKFGMGKGVIIGVIDTGITPGHPSFDDTGMPAPPSKWKGRCEFQNSVCNRKLIGARNFVKDIQMEDNSPPIDDEGHGTHTASTAAGNFVSNANMLGSGNGTAAGMSPRAHLAIYKACSEIGCSESNVLAAMDAAINDGVDILSLSLGGGPSSFDEDSIAIGSFAAIQKGIVVSCAGGNGGPSPFLLSNAAPWILTVGASTMDRKFKAVVTLGDGQEIEGESLFQTTNVPFTPIVHPPSCDSSDLGDVKGKIVVCVSSVAPGDNVKAAGGAAMILTNKDTQGYTILAQAFDLPASIVNYVNGTTILSYVEKSQNATASITFKGTTLGNSPAPTIAYFSSRGPSQQTLEILKPDIVGPGVNILAAWPDQVGEFATKLTKKNFNIISGTSMSTPHLSGIAALIKSMHPNWSPAAIKSAMITTSQLLDNNGNPIMDEKNNPADHFSMGAGHVDASKAINPGLVYDISPEEFIGLLCGLGYTDKQVQTITNEKVACKEVKKIEQTQLNYPSITTSASTSNLVVNRTVTNVGTANAKYTAEVVMPKGVTVSVSPNVLQFSNVNEKQSFTVSMSWTPADSAYIAGNLNWVSGENIVRIPIVIYKSQ
ncbi:Subtilisin-like protease SBT1.2 [Rhynchospora pubera]|uniref:Subtilisin-like protease SBT1.2 n=1 Tax=Rhynchospora pubera TaxID=906938 RepID=A0AAV8HAS4_9POAL|nr:Subtilisin-like protease SBT1.2 [Rhynchospora pubera]